MIDPQCQAMNWIKSMEGQKLRVIDLQMKHYMSILEEAIQNGWPVLLQNLLQTFDPGLDPVLNKSLIRTGGADIMKLGDREVQYNHDFRSVRFTNIVLGFTEALR